MHVGGGHKPPGASSLLAAAYPGWEGLWITDLLPVPKWGSLKLFLRRCYTAGAESRPPGMNKLVARCLARLWDPLQGLPVSLVLVPSWALLLLSPHLHAVLSLALAGGSLLSPSQSCTGPQPSSSPVSGQEVCSSALLGCRSCLLRWAPEGAQGHSPPAA